CCVHYDRVVQQRACSDAEREEVFEDYKDFAADTGAHLTRACTSGRRERLDTTCDGYPWRRCTHRNEPTQRETASTSLCSVERPWTTQRPPTSPPCGTRSCCGRAKAQGLCSSLGRISSPS